MENINLCTLISVVPTHTKLYQNIPFKQEDNVLIPNAHIF